MKLISMTDFALRQGETSTHETEQQDWYFKEVVKLDKIRNYAQFLKQPLELWMFVPCHLVDGVWKVLEYPDDAKDYIFRGDSMRHEDLQEYQQAKERCLFEGFEINTRKFNKLDYKLIENKDTYVYFLCNIQNKWIKVNDYKTIECLAFYNLQLTATAQKQIGCDH